MTKLPRTLAAAVILAAATFAATPLNAAGEETLRYKWRLRGPLAWIARVKLPTSGTGVLQTSPGSHGVETSLRVVAGDKGYLEYRSQMDDLSRRTYSSVNRYQFGSEMERKETVYDYRANVARVAARDEKESETKTRPLVVDDARDALTTIAYIRKNAGSISTAQTTNLFSDGKQYRVTIEPQGVQTTECQGRRVAARVFKVSAAPGAKAQKGDFKIWLSEDSRRVPLRIVLEQRHASLDLRLDG